ncbi:hypothetical protein [Rhizobium sp. BK377]|uniref:hypothetical protein n=1 Tax=Rhizobium sp. BK377 TaxID=2587058 RepID=UPI0016200636|nr:hypothetical protein [Rhizobium sp. BK377]MBB3461344.1 hypothetical protein [Rhizobium sp. BK377]
MSEFFNRACAIMLLCAPLSSCFGLAIPAMHGIFEDTSDQTDKENTLVNLVKCQLKEGVVSVLNQYATTGPGKGYGAHWLERWAAKVTFTLTAKETGGLSPNFSYTNPPEVFSLGVGVNSNTDATRTETTGVTWSVPDIIADAAIIPCRHFGPIQVYSNLDISEWLVRKAFLARVPGNIDRQKLNSPFNAFNYEATFVSSFSGGVNPSWSFTRRDVNSNTTLLSISRVRTDAITITMGPAEKDEFGGFRLAPDAEDIRRATLFGQAVRAQ